MRSAKTMTARVVADGDFGRRRERGMTLIEVLTVMTIMCVVGAGISATLTTSWSSQQTITDQNEMQRRAQVAVNTIVDDVRSMSRVDALASGRLDATQTDRTLNTLRTVSYRLDPLTRELLRGESGQTSAGEVICRDVTALRFEYYKVTAYGTTLVPETNSPLNAQSILVSVTVTSGNTGATGTSWVKLRNRY